MNENKEGPPRERDDPEAGGDRRWRYPGLILQTDVSTAIVKRSKTIKKGLFALTERRQQVAILAAGGLSNRAIAEELDLTEGTVKIHIHKIFKKLDLHSRIQLIIALANRRKRMPASTHSHSLPAGAIDLRGWRRKRKAQATVL